LKFTPPSPIKATPITIANNSDDVSTTSGSNVDDVMMTSSSQNKELLNNHGFYLRKTHLREKITAIIAVMRDKPKDGYHRHCSNKHYKQKIVQVLLDSGSNGDLVFVNKDKPMQLHSLIRLIPWSWITLNEYSKLSVKLE
jgi:hypothetical protein